MNLGLEKSEIRKFIDDNMSAKESYFMQMGETILCRNLSFALNRLIDEPTEANKTIFFDRLTEIRNLKLADHWYNGMIQKQSLGGFMSIIKQDEKVRQAYRPATLSQVEAIKENIKQKIDIYSARALKS